MAQKFKQEDKVKWQAGQGTTVGTVAATGNRIH